MLQVALGINHQSPLIHLVRAELSNSSAGNQSPIPFDTLGLNALAFLARWESITNPL